MSAARPGGLIWWVGLGLAGLWGLTCAPQGPAGGSIETSRGAQVALDAAERAAAVTAWRQLDPLAQVVEISLGRGVLLPVLRADLEPGEAHCDVAWLLPHLIHLIREPIVLTTDDYPADALATCRAWSPEADARAQALRFRSFRAGRYMVGGIHSAPISEDDRDREVLSYGPGLEGIPPILGGSALAQFGVPDGTVRAVVPYGYARDALILMDDGSVVQGVEDSLLPELGIEGRFVQLVTTDLGLVCGLKADGTVRCFGREAVGPLAAPEGRYIEQCAGAFFWCGLTAEGRVRCEGEDLYGETAIPDGRLYGALGCGSETTCVAPVDGDVECYGRFADDVLRPPPGLRAAHVVVNGRQACALSHAGGMRCWGDHSFERLPDGTWLLPEGPPQEGVAWPAAAR